MSTIHAADSYTTTLDAGRIAAVPGYQRTLRRITEETEPGDLLHAFAAGADAAFSWLDPEVSASLIEHGIETRTNPDALPGPNPFACACCGRTNARTFVVTTGDYANPREEQTEECLVCWLSENLPEAMFAPIMAALKLDPNDDTSPAGDGQPASEPVTYWPQGTCSAHVDVHAFNSECVGWRDYPVNT